VGKGKLDTLFKGRDAGVFKAREPKGANLRLTAGETLRMQRRKEVEKKRWASCTHTHGTVQRKRLNGDGAYGQRGSRVERAHLPHVVQTPLKPTYYSPHALRFYTLALAFTNPS